MKLGTALIILLLAVIALAAEFFLYFVFGIGAAFDGDLKQLGTTAVVFIGLMLLTATIGILSPVGALLELVSKRRNLGIWIVVAGFLIVSASYSFYLYYQDRSEIRVITKDGARRSGDYSMMAIAAETEVRMLKSSLDTLRSDIGRYPTKEEGLEILIKQPTEEVAAQKWRGPYLSAGLPTDPWDNPYIYVPVSPFGISLFSAGSDGKIGGENEAADIGLFHNP